MLEAKDLPSSHISDDLEKRVFAKLQQERESRAKGEAKDIDEVCPKKTYADEVNWFMSFI